MHKKRIALFSAGVVAAGLLATVPSTAGATESTNRIEIAGLRGPASVVRDVDGIPHIRALNTYDLFFLHGWVHADDRLFQMDSSRRQASGTLAELLGSAALPGDVQMRTLGLRRVAERSLSGHTPETQDALKAYADGVNAWIARNKLPSQYAAVQITKVEPWTVVDSLVVNKLLAFSVSFDLDIDRTTAVRAYDAAGLNGHTAFLNDLAPFAPFNTASPVIDATGRPFNPGSASAPAVGGKGVSDVAARLAAEYLKKAQQTPAIVEAMNREADRGSNSWVISGRHTATGRPILAGDPHVALAAPATAHPIALDGAGYHFQGESIPGSPFIIFGQNRNIAWGSTMHASDVTDTYVEQLRPDPASPSGVSTVFKGTLEPVVAIPETFRVNTRTPGQQDAVAVLPAGNGIPAQTFIVPRRNNGPLVMANLGAGTGISVQYTGFSPSTELDAFRMFAKADGIDDFRKALQYFDVGAQHFTFADVKGNIAYFNNGEVPIREDLQAGKVQGNPPYLLRDGTGGNEWLPVKNRQPNQSLPYEILPSNELAQVINPPAGFVVSANNDPTGNSFDNDVLNQLRPGGGIYYLSVLHNGFRAGRITDMIRAAIRKGRITTDDVIDMQADVTALDGQFFTPRITAALQRAKRSSTPELAALAKDKRVVEAVARLGDWRHTYPTGIREGFDASDRNGVLSTPSRREIEESAAATIFALWRSRFVVNVLDQSVQRISKQLPLPGDSDSVKALRQLLIEFDTRKGVGRSGIDFFAVPGIADAADRRDFLILKSMADALTMAASGSFKAAFNNSTDQTDYRWGKLHRYVLPSPLGAPFTIPSQGNRFTSPLPGLPGIPVDGGSNVPDVAPHIVRGDDPEDFVASMVPIRRLVAQPTPIGMRSVNSLAGGASEELDSKFEQNLLRPWLTNDTYPVRLYPQDLIGATDSITLFLPARR